MFDLKKIVIIQTTRKQFDNKRFNVRQYIVCACVERFETYSLFCFPVQNEFASIQNVSVRELTVVDFLNFENYFKANLRQIFRKSISNQTSYVVFLFLSSRQSTVLWLDAFTGRQRSFAVFRSDTRPFGRQPRQRPDTRAVRYTSGR